MEVDPQKGLSRAEARRRLHRQGPNQLQVHTRRPAWRILVGQFTNLIIGLLSAAGILSLAFGQGTEAAAIGIAIVLNAAIGFFTELRASRSMESLRRMGQATAKVVRGGKKRELPAAELVPGDVVELEAGDVVPADLRLVEAN
ncbi:MAG: cation-transporting P-type ATPase, partial [Desulfarculaceae bacterium]|nr:cation-transporting P-type ATPase [Desulfarculaceae bacterium]